MRARSCAAGRTAEVSWRECPDPRNDRGSAEGERTLDGAKRVALDGAQPKNGSRIAKEAMKACMHRTPAPRSSHNIAVDGINLR